MATTRLMTADDLDLLDDDKKYELIDGELYEVPPANGEHGEVAHRIVILVDRFEPSRNHVVGWIAEAPFLLTRAPDSVVSPDASFIKLDHLPSRAARRKRVEVAPDIAVEVVSPSDRASMVTRKVSRYLAAGTERVWVVDPEARTVAVYGPGGFAQFLEEGDVLDGGDVIPGLQIKVFDIFDLAE